MADFILSIIAGNLKLFFVLSVGTVAVLTFLLISPSVTSVFTNPLTAMSISISNV
jgi:hypothetical protein